MMQDHVETHYVNGIVESYVCTFDAHVLNRKRFTITFSKKLNM